MVLSQKTEKKERKSLTMVFIPHHGSSIHQWRVPHWFLYTFCALLLGLVGSAGWVLSRHIQYQIALKQVEQLRQNNLKIAQELTSGQAALAKVAQLDLQLRRLLKFKTKKALLEYYAEGGPSEEDQVKLSSLLEEQAEKAGDQVSENINSLRYQASVQVRSLEELKNYVDKQRSLMARTPHSWPVRGWITSYFGTRSSPFSGGESFHSGVDIANDSGTPIRATADGIVRFAGWEGGFGKLVVVDHGNGLMTYYGHNAQIKVSVGQRVRRHTILALMGSTGEATGPHCHYEVRLHGVAVNPLKYMKN